MWIGNLEEIKWGDYYEYHCENFIVFWWMIPIKKNFKHIWWIPLRCSFHIKINFKHMDDPIPKEYKVSCWKIMWMTNIASVVLKYVW
jgi:hypothetical protein